MIKSKLKKFLRENERKGYYQPIEGFLEFKATASAEAFKYRLETILDFCDKGTFLDLGCNIGFDSFGLARAGNKVVGVEHNDKVFPVLEKLNEYYGLNTEFVKSRIRDYVPDREFDYSMFLIIFHHLWLEDEKMAFDTLNRIAEKTKKYVLMAVRPKRELANINIPETIIQKSILNHYQELGDKQKMARGIALYAFSK